MALTCGGSGDRTRGGGQPGTREGGEGHSVYNPEADCAFQSRGSAPVSLAKLAVVFPSEIIHNHSGQR